MPRRGCRRPYVLNATMASLSHALDAAAGDPVGARGRLRGGAAVTLHDCTLCGHAHAIPWSAWCAVCWGYALGCVPDEIDDGEVVGRG